MSVLSLAAAPGDLLLEIAAHLDCRRDVFNFCLTVSESRFSAHSTGLILVIEQQILHDSLIHSLHFSYSLFSRTMFHNVKDAHKATRNRTPRPRTRRQAWSSFKFHFCWQSVLSKCARLRSCQRRRNVQGTRCPGQIYLGLWWCSVAWWHVVCSPCLVRPDFSLLRVYSTDIPPVAASFVMWEPR